MNKFFATFVLTMAFALSAFAQTYSTPTFSADFNGKVEVSTKSYATNNNTIYSSISNGIEESVVVRTVDHDIDVNTTSSQFYRSNTVGAELVPENNSDGVYQGRPYSYGLFKITDNGVTFWQRERIIIVNSRTVIFIQMVMSEEKESKQAVTSGNALQVWQDFENTLNIK